MEEDEEEGAKLGKAGKEEGGTACLPPCPRLVVVAQHRMEGKKKRRE